MTYIAPPTVRAKFSKRRPASGPPKERPYPYLGHELGYVHYGIHTYDVHDAGDNGKVYQVAIRYLAGGMPRRAEQLIKQVVNAGFTEDPASGVTSCHVGYHWALAILRGRTFDQLGSVGMQDLRDAVTFGHPAPGDTWAVALNVVERFLYALLKQQSAAGLAAASLGQILADYQRLDPDRRDEIRRHLDTVLDGELADRLDAAHDTDQAVLRLAADRASRVPKFFEPIPAPPKPVALAATSLNPWQRWAAIIGAGLFLIGLIAALLDGAFTNVVLAALAALLVPISGFLIWQYARRVLAAFGRLSDRNRDYFYSSQFIANRQISRYEFPPMVPQNDDQIRANPRHWLYRRMLRSYLTFRFRLAGARSPDEPLRWSSETAGRSESLEREMLYLYEPANNEPGSSDYLLRLHVDEVANKFRARTLFSYQKQLSPGRLPLFGFTAGALFAAAGVGIAIALALASYLPVAIGALVLLGVGGWLVWWSRVDVYLVGQERLPDDEDDRDTRLAAELRQYDAEVAFLADRPSDAEMARWLDYDLIQLKKRAMQQHGLANRDLFAHAAVAEAGYRRKRARVVHGPWRYSLYTITLFLLTDEGIRLIASDVDFTTGRVTDERRTDFSYSAVSAAKAAQITHRYDGARRIIVDDSEVAPAQAARPVRSNGMQVSISTGWPITVVLERFTDGYFNRAVEDLNQLKDNALDSSGLAAALRILEPVGAEGRQWLALERLRRSRRLASGSPQGPGSGPFPFSQPVRLVASAPATRPSGPVPIGTLPRLLPDLPPPARPSDAGRTDGGQPPDSSGSGPADTAADTEKADGSPGQAAAAPSTTGGEDQEPDQPAPWASQPVWPNVMRPPAEEAGAPSPGGADQGTAAPDAPQADDGAPGAATPAAPEPGAAASGAASDEPADPAEPADGQPADSAEPADGQPADSAEPAEGQPAVQASGQNPIQALMKLSQRWRKPAGKTRKDKSADKKPDAPSQ